MRPQSEAELAEIIKDASEPFRIVGGGTRDIGNPVDAAPLQTSGLAGIKLYEPGSLTLVVGAGTPVAEVEAALASEGQRLPFEPVDHRGLLGQDGVPTIGGMAAVNASGPRRIQAGACRDLMLGVRFVDGRGQVLSNGGRVMKNVTGYDLVKLMAGSHGTLGVLTEVAFKVLPEPEASACVLIDGLEDEAAVQALSRALGSPFDVTGAAHVPVGLDGHPVTMIRLEGFAGSVAYRAEQMAALFAGHSVRIERDPEAIRAGWRFIRDVEPMQAVPGDVWRLSVKPSDAPGLVARSGAVQSMYDWGGGLVWLLVESGTDLRAKLGAFDGHATLVRASEDTRRRLPVFQPEAAPIAAIAQGLRAKFDPKGLLNPGRMG
jgi:glycolate oxidase FAD binding subunit